MIDNSISHVVPLLKPNTFKAARRASHGWDVHFLEEKWKIEAAVELAAGNIFVRDYPDEHFILFCHDWFKKHGRPA